MAEPVLGGDALKRVRAFELVPVRRSPARTAPPTL